MSTTLAYNIRLNYRLFQNSVKLEGYLSMVAQRNAATTARLTMVLHHDKGFQTA